MRSAFLDAEACRQETGFGVRAVNRAAMDSLHWRRPMAPAVVLICYGGMVPYAMDAAYRAFMAEEIVVELVIPALIKPVPLADLIPEIARCGKVLVAEEGVTSGGWGAEVASLIHEAAFDQLEGPVRRARCPGRRSRARGRWKRRCFLRIATSNRRSMRWRSVTGRLRPAGCPVNARSSQHLPALSPGLRGGQHARRQRGHGSPPGGERDSVLVARWLVADGGASGPGQPVCDVETTKTAIALKPGRMGSCCASCQRAGRPRVGSAVA